MPHHPYRQPFLAPDGRYEIDSLQGIDYLRGQAGSAQLAPTWIPRVLPQPMGADVPLPPALTTGQIPVGSGLSESEVTKLIIVGLVICVIAWLLLKPKSGNRRLQSNPDGDEDVSSGSRHHARGVNKVAKLSQSPSGAWFWKLMRKGSRRHGPFSSSEAAIEAAEARGYGILDTRQC